MSDIYACSSLRATVKGADVLSIEIYDTPAESASLNMIDKCALWAKAHPQKFVVAVRHVPMCESQPIPIQQLMQLFGRMNEEGKCFMEKMIGICVYFPTLDTVAQNLWNIFSTIYKAQPEHKPIFMTQDASQWASHVHELCSS